jgi:hypothetical protein
MGVAQPTVINPSSGTIAPNGIGVTPNNLYFSQPYCTGAAGQARGVYSATNLTPGSPAWTATIGLVDSITDSACAENYFFISPGLGGFPAGSIFTTNPNGVANEDQVLKDGAIFIPAVPDSAPGHAGLTFDTVGTFNYDLIVTTPSGITFYNSAGAIQSAMTVAAPTGVYLETATVAPSSLNPGCAGCLYVTSTNPGHNGIIYTVTPGSTTLTLAVTAPGAEPEGILFVPPLACKLTGTNFTYFVSAYASGSEIDNNNATNGSLLAYSQLQTSSAGKALVPFESGSIYSYDGVSTFTLFDTPLVPVTNAGYQLEGASMTACTPAAGGCPATQGFWKHHAMATPTLVIGGVTYTNAQLVTLLDTAPKGGDATLILVHQLIAALANEAAGAKHAGIMEDGMSVDTAIADAQLLLASGLPQGGFPGTNPAGVIFPINLLHSTGTFVQSGTTLGGYFTTLSNVLNDYNSAVGLHCSEGSGLI